ncbi:MarR family winged helix-turn-helix transcriptional regulator [Pseudomarimonas arenosa]|uniref:Winged helix-turn-helix transcriptional regulator n=1 Tax=Pseudomarimonas arenosa TaxID=2774145 RepID=A0AAW3ZJN4_9GAMM|nr:MarR family winged helix-turn-helix transcriptional regulator [Pseudomarimonas arenosa]MBD8524924.1 winged helix-turn-helix transcriptional regulator [Pseudomarimonas arenosa]
MTETPHAVLALETFLPYRLSVLSNRISNDIAQFYQRRFGLSVTEWRAMAVIGRYPGISAVDVTERTAMDKVAVSRAVNALLQRQLVERRFDETDRRRSILRLTDAGVSIYDEIAPLALKLEASLLESFAPGEREVLMRLLDKLDAAEMRAHL